jgi:hypothetical protein
MTLLLWSFVVVEGKTRKSGENRWRVVSDRGSLICYASRARLTNRATSLQPTATPQKHHTTKREKRTTIKEGIKPYTIQTDLIIKSRVSCFCPQARTRARWSPNKGIDVRDERDGTRGQAR